MDTYLAIVSKRDNRRYYERRIPDDVVGRILDAGRVTGSASNKQPWRFLVVEDAERRKRLADAVYEPTTSRRALVVAIAGARPMDIGRCAQNMMLAAWKDGVASCPNGIGDKEWAAEVLGLNEAPVTVLSFGYPARQPAAESRSAEEWSAAQTASRSTRSSSGSRSPSPRYLLGSRPPRPRSRRR